MRITFLSIATILFLASTAGAADEWKLVWQDEFDGDSLNYDQWEIEVNAFGGGNHEMQIYTDRKENVRVEDGHLVLEARRDNHAISGTVREYSSGRVRSKRRGDWKYGRFEARMKLPKGQGLWPAFWMMPSDDVYGGWASSGEIDIMEFKGQEPNKCSCAIHFGGGWPNNKYTAETFTLPEGETFTDDFHVFALEWEEGVLRWYIDGKLWRTTKEWSTTGGDFPAPFDQPFHIILNLAVGGGFVGPPNNETAFPAQVLVDYVRVYQK